MRPCCGTLRKEQGERRKKAEGRRNHFCGTTLLTITPVIGVEIMCRCCINSVFFSRTTERRRRTEVLALRSNQQSLAFQRLKRSGGICRTTPAVMFGSSKKPPLFVCSLCTFFSLRAAMKNDVAFSTFPFLWMFLRTPLFLSKKTHLRPSSGVRRLGATAAQPGGSGEVRPLTRRRTLLLLLCPSPHSSPAVLAVGRRTEQTRGSRRGMPLPLSQAHQQKKKHSKTIACVCVCVSHTGSESGPVLHNPGGGGISAVCAPLTTCVFFFLLTGDSSRCESRRFLVGGCPPVSTSPPVSRPSVPPDNPIATHTHKIEEARERARSSFFL